jgi:hypothetical protein
MIQNEAVRKILANERFMRERVFGAKNKPELLAKKLAEIDLVVAYIERLEENYDYHDGARPDIETLFGGG